jgi:hypothetical protein
MTEISMILLILRGISEAIGILAKWRELADRAERGENITEEEVNQAFAEMRTALNRMDETP